MMDTAGLRWVAASTALVYAAVRTHHGHVGLSTRSGIRSIRRNLLLEAEPLPESREIGRNGIDIHQNVRQRRPLDR